VKAGKIRFISKYGWMLGIEWKSEIENSWERIYLAVGSMICLRDVMGEYEADLVQAPLATGLSKLIFILVADETCYNWRKGLASCTDRLIADGSRNLLLSICCTSHRRK
jgi:hypothetical protein